MSVREDEIKYLLAGREDHRRLLAGLAGKSCAEAQTNRYLDTADLRLAGRLAMLRLRSGTPAGAVPGAPPRPPAARLTLKRGTEVEAGYFRSIEVEADLTPGDLSAVLADPRRIYDLDLPPVSELRRLFGELPLTVIGTLENERTTFRGGPFVVEVDRMVFPGGAEEYEVEVETRDAGAAREWLLAEFARLDVCAEPGRATKFERLLRKIGDPRAPAPAVPDPRSMPEKSVLDGQAEIWESAFSRRPDLLGRGPSAPARWAAGAFRSAGVGRILELGCGAGRDAFYLAGRGFRVAALDASRAALGCLASRARQAGITGSVEPLLADVRRPLPFPDGAFDAAYSHMLFCMALTEREIVRLAREVLRVLRPGGLHFATVRRTGDPHWRTGTDRGEGLRETDGFIVHFFSQEKLDLIAADFEVLGVEEFEEGELPRKLFRLALRKRPPPP